MWITIKSWPIELEEVNAQDYLLCYHNGPHLDFEITEGWHWNFDCPDIGYLSIANIYRLTFSTESLFWNYKTNYKYNNPKEQDEEDITVYKLYYICG